MSLPREAIEEHTLDAMLKKAQELGLDRGVAAIQILQDNESYHRLVWRENNTIERDPDPMRGPDDTGTNYLAVVLSKIAQMVSTHTDSSKLPRPKKFGEFGFGGGLTIRRATGYLCAAYSGGTVEEDIEVAMAGMDVLWDNL